jgi:predicted nucleic-acid-binding Zn-ribbon protein
MTALGKFDSFPAVCPKCGFEVESFADRQVVRFVMLNVGPFGRDEHLHVECRECGYAIDTETYEESLPR